MTTPAVRRVTVRRGKRYEFYDRMTGEPCPMVLEVVESDGEQIVLLVEQGIGVRFYAEPCRIHTRNHVYLIPCTNTKPCRICDEERAQ